MKNTVTIVKMRVFHNPIDKLYYVYEKIDEQKTTDEIYKDTTSSPVTTWQILSKGYKYQTSAFAALGRIVAEESM